MADLKNEESEAVPPKKKWIITWKDQTAKFPVLRIASPDVPSTGAGKAKDITLGDGNKPKAPRP